MDQLKIEEIQDIPVEELSIDEAREEIDRLDADIISALRRRTAVSKRIGEARLANGGTRLVHSREMKIIERFSELGPDGKDIAMAILKLGRGALGRERPQ